MTNTMFRIEPISATEAANLREQGGELYVADAFPGYPCRQCLRDAEIGEELLLVSHDPFGGASPYRSASPIFVHRDDCGGPGGGDDLPVQLTRRQLSVRGFDDGEMMVEAALIDGQDLATTLAQFFGADEVDKIHIHNAGRGCWAATALRRR